MKDTAHKRKRSRKPRTILLKLGGEALAPASGQGLDAGALDRIAREIAQLVELGVRLGVVLGGGNFLRGRDTAFLDRISADQIGMLATALNGLALQSALEQHGVSCVVQSALPIAFTDPVHPRRARQRLSEGCVVLYVGGTGNPLVSTDTAAAVHAVELGAEILLKGSYTDGVYDKDPKRHPAAKRYAAISFEQAIQDRLKVMDLAAFELCSRSRMPILVFDVRVPGNLIKAAAGRAVGTRVG